MIADTPPYSVRVVEKPDYTACKTYQYAIAKITWQDEKKYIL